MLTEKEMAVLRMKQQGLLQQQIAKKLKVSQPAVSNFYNNALWKIRDAQLTLKNAKDMGVVVGHE